MNQTPVGDLTNLRRLGSGCGAVFFGLFISAGLFFSGLGVRAAWRDHASAAWPRVPGRIIRSEVKDTSDSDGNSYRPDIAYRYQVDGREFTGDRVAFGIEKFSAGELFARQCVGRYPVGVAVTVAYQPGKPEVSTLEAGLTRRSFLRAVLGLSFVVMGGYVAWLCRCGVLFESLGERPFRRVLPAFFGFGTFFGLLYWLSVS